MKNHNRTQFLKQLALLIFGAVFVSVLYAQLDIPTNINNAVQTIGKIVLTPNGQVPSATNPAVVTIDANASGSVSAVKVLGSMNISPDDSSSNTLSAIASSIIGKLNRLFGNQSLIVGYNNTGTTTAVSSVIFGENNSLSGTDSAILGGKDNKVNGNYSTAGGQNAQANHPYTWVWSDYLSSYDPAEFASAKSNTFLIRAFNGVGINTANPGATLDVNGSFKQGASYRSVIQLPMPGANVGAGRWYIRLHPSNQTNLASVKVTVQGSWNYAPIMGWLTAEYSYYSPGNGTINTNDFRVTSTEGTAYTNLRIGDLVVENGYISIPVWSANTNSPTVIVEYSDFGIIKDTLTNTNWASNALPAQNFQSIQGNLHVDGNLGVGINAPATRLDVNGTTRYRGDSQMDAGYSAYFGKEESFGGADFGGADYGFIRWDNDNNTYAYWGDSSENGALVIGSMNDGNNSVSDSVVLKPSGSTIVDSQMIVNGNVGIGTTNPAAKLDVRGPFRITQSSPAGYQFTQASDNTSLQLSYYVDAVTKHKDLINFNYDGNVGIGNTSPATKLDVAGALTINGPTASSTYALFKNAGTSIGLLGSDASIYGGIATNMGLYVYGPNQFDLSTNGAKRFSVTSDGNVGIGTTTPIAKLEVAGGNGTSKFYKEVVTGQPDYSNFYLKLFKLSSGNNWDATTFNGKICALRSNDIGASQCADVYVGRDYYSAVHFSQTIGAVAGGYNTPFQLVKLNDGGFDWITLLYDARSGAGITSWVLDGTLYNGNAADVVALTSKTSTSNIHSTLTYITRNTSIPYGNLGIGTATPTEKFEVLGNIKSPGLYTKGTGVSAAGNYSTAMGYGSTSDCVTYTGLSVGPCGANATYSTVMGYQTTAKGESSTAMGANSIAIGIKSTAMGDKTQAIGANSLAGGTWTIALGGNAISLGNASIAKGADSVALGKWNTALGDNSFVVGQSNFATGSYSRAMGYDTRAEGAHSTAIGYKTYAKGQYSTAMGYGQGVNNNYGAIGTYSTAIGLNNRAGADQSTALGSNTVAMGLYSTTMGYSTTTTTNGYMSTAMGGYTTANGNFTTVMGLSTTANGHFSTAMGRQTTTNSQDSTAMGYYNVGYADSLLEVGAGGYSQSNGQDMPANALTIYNNGALNIETHAGNGYQYSLPDYRSSSFTIYDCGGYYCGYDDNGTYIDVYPSYNDGYSIYASEISLDRGNYSAYFDYNVANMWRNGNYILASNYGNGWYLDGEVNGYSPDGGYTMQGYYGMYLVQNDGPTTYIDTAIANSAISVSPVANVAIGSDISHDTSTTADKLTVYGKTNFVGNAHGHSATISNTADNAGTYFNLKDHDGYTSSIASFDTNFSQFPGLANSLAFMLRSGKNLNFFTSTDGNPGSSKMILKNNGNLGIGTSNPDKTLDVVGTIRASESIETPKLIVDKLVNRFVSNISVSGQLLPDTNAPTTSQTIGSATTGWKALYAGGITALSNGNVGIGVSPTQKFEVNGNTKINGFINTNIPVQYPGDYGYDPSYVMVQWDEDGWIRKIPSSELRVGYSNYADYASSASYADSAYSAYSAEYASNANYASYAYNISNQYNGSPVTFALQGSEKMRILTNGNVGIGTASPSAKLDVRGPFRITQSSPAGYQFTQASDNTSLQLSYYVDATTKHKDLMNFNYDGNVGIGTTSPTQKLEVNGNAKINGTISATNISSTIVGNNIVQRDANGYIYSNYLNTTAPEEIAGETMDGDPSHVMVQWDNDGWIRKTPTSSLWVGGANYASSASSAYNLIPTRTNWNSYGNISAVVGQLGWKNYGNNHTIFDASAGTSPSGTAINKSNSQYAWTSNYPTLMGWDGSSTYGVRVDSSRVAGYADEAYYAEEANYAGSASYAYQMYDPYYGGGWYMEDDTWIRTLGSKNIYHDSGIMRTDGQLQVGDSGNRFLVNQAGKVGIGNTNPEAMLHVNGNIQAAGSPTPSNWYNLQAGSVGVSTLYGYTALCVGNEASNCTASNGVVLGISNSSANINLKNDGNASFKGTILAGGFYYSSDITLKKNITPLDNALDKINKLNGYSFSWKANDQKDIGVIAQEVEKVFPDLVHTNDAGIKSVEYGNLVAPIIEAIKELSQKVESLFAKYVDQEARINALEQRLQKLEAHK